MENARVWRMEWTQTGRFFDESAEFSKGQV